MKISMGYPSFEDELQIMQNGEHSSNRSKQISPVMTTADIEQLINVVKEVRVQPSVRKYILDIVTATRNSPYVRLGVSPRGSIALLRTSKAYAFINGRDYVVPDDVKAVMIETLAHRMILSAKGKSAFESNEQALEGISMTVASPVEAG